VDRMSVGSVEILDPCPGSTKRSELRLREKWVGIHDEQERQRFASNA
jgi:hypothetical protein